MCMDIYDPVTHTMISSDALPHTYSYNGDGTVNTDTVTNGTDTWVKTYGYTGGKMTSETAWVLQ